MATAIKSKPKSKLKKSAQAEVRTVDSKARIILPKEFAGTTVVCEAVAEGELRIRKAVIIPETDLPLAEDSLKPLSNTDRDFFLKLIENPPAPSKRLKDALKRHRERHG